MAEEKVRMLHISLGSSPTDTHKDGPFLLYVTICKRSNQSSKIFGRFYCRKELRRKMWNAEKQLPEHATHKTNLQERLHSRENWAAIYCQAWRSHQLQATSVFPVILYENKKPWSEMLHHAGYWNWTSCDLVDRTLNFCRGYGRIRSSHWYYIFSSSFVLQYAPVIDNQIKIKISMVAVLRTWHYWNLPWSDMTVVRILNYLQHV